MEIASNYVLASNKYFIILKLIKLIQLIQQKVTFLGITNTHERAQEVVGFIANPVHAL